MTVPDMIADPDGFDETAEFYVMAAQAAIRRECGWHVMPNTELEGVLNSRGGTVLRFPAQHVTSVESLTDRQGHPIPYAYDPDTGLIECTQGAFPAGVGAVRYRIYAGYDDAPDVQQVLASMAKRMALTPVGLVKSQSVNGSSASYDAATLMADEKARLKPYKLGGMP